MSGLKNNTVNITVPLYKSGMPHLKFCAVLLFHLKKDIAEWRVEGSIIKMIKCIEKLSYEEAVKSVHFKNFRQETNQMRCYKR